MKFMLTQPTWSHVGDFKITEPTKRHRSGS